MVDGVRWSVTTELRHPMPFGRGLDPFGGDPWKQLRLEPFDADSLHPQLDHARTDPDPCGATEDVPNWTDERLTERLVELLKMRKDGADLSCSPGERDPFPNGPSVGVPAQHLEHASRCANC